MIPLFKVFMADSAADEVAKVLNSGFIGEGPKALEFANNLKAWIGNYKVATTNSATSAEHLALRLIKQPYSINDGDEVLATPLTCTATNWPILANNLKIKWVDVDNKTLNMDLDDLERKITPTTKAIFLVHWGGYPVDLNRVKKITEKCQDLYGFKPVVIEDCAHAFGSKYKGKKLGNHGNFCTFSFQAIKHMTSVDGGMLVCPDEESYRRAKLLRWYGIDRETERTDFRCELDIPEWGYKFHMNDVMATVGLENLKHADRVIQAHRDNAAYYDAVLNTVPGVRTLAREDGFESSFWIYSMYVDDKPGFMKHMNECGITVSQVHERNDIHSCVKEFNCALPTLNTITPKLISIPVGWWVTKEQREYIVDCIKKGW
jgi:dTDP-4-amino-4,6-dideoxygalactose transaminase